MLTSALLRRTFLKWVLVLHKSTMSASACFSSGIKERGTAARLSSFKSTINHGEGKEYDRPVIHHAVEMPFQMVIGPNVSAIVTAVSRQRGGATRQRGKRLRAASFTGDARSDLCRPRGAGSLHVSPKLLLQRRKA